MIANRDLRPDIDIIFSNDNQYQAAVPIAGREQQLSELGGLIHADGPQLVWLSAPLGAGKTFFLDKFFGRLSNTSGFSEQRNRRLALASTDHAWDSARLRSEFEGRDTAHRPVLEVEEIDRKCEFNDAIRMVENACQWLSETDNGLLILTGDRLLEHPRLLEVVARCPAQRTDVSLGVLDEHLLVDALALRISHKLIAKTETAPEEAVVAARALFKHAAVRDCVIPPTNPGIANFREALGLLRQLMEQATSLVNGVELPPELLPKVVRNSRLLEEQIAVDDYVLEHISLSRANRAPIEPITLEEIRSQCPGMDDEDFALDIVDPLVRANVLVPMGIPYLVGQAEDPSRAFSPPFLPNQDAFIRGAAAGQMA